ncbi:MULTISPECIES: hypothetical protein [unclassified Moorena]|uniref:hypothetical protein n=1 Tax=unclassified Moorena TaxID=2683338 RepID=UPI0013BC0520|nr:MULTISPECIES: hypothetical protein [unclassified Moorena]NEQ11034.1 hypothetical protein [Moorena sp. SIO4E2]NEQ13019.1 hypothetical protein [Moorena sp. SIO3E2]NER86714.1 hypothetical protein [Moorena sp. SIO3A2]NES45884.1 hypothetical protein [Moorena sp. SIO2C4]
MGRWGDGKQENSLFKIGISDVSFLKVVNTITPIAIAFIIVIRYTEFFPYSLFPAPDSRLPIP